MSSNESSGGRLGLPFTSLVILAFSHSFPMWRFPSLLVVLSFTAWHVVVKAYDPGYARKHMFKRVLHQGIKFCVAN